MYKVVIADDEVRVCQLIRLLIDWQALGLEIVDTVHNGEAALELVERVHPDILIADIRMPKCNGLNLIKMVKERSKDTRCIIISGHRQFEYAQTALKNGAEDYLLKPIKADDLTESLKKIIRLKEEEKVSLERVNDLEKTVADSRENLARAFVTDIMGGTAGREELNVDYINNKLHLAFNRNKFLVFNIKIDVDNYAVKRQEVFLLVKAQICRPLEHNLSAYKDRLMYKAEDDEICGIINFSSDEFSDILSSFRHFISDVNNLGDTDTKPYVTVGVSQVTDSLEGITASVNESKQAVKQRIIDGVDRIISYDPQRFKNQPESLMNRNLREKVIEAFEKHSEKMLGEAEKELADAIGAGYVSGFTIYSSVMDWIDLMAENAKRYIQAEKAGELGRKLKTQIYSDYTVEHILKDMPLIVSKVAEALPDAFPQNRKKPIEEASEYLHEHFAEALTQEEVAGKVGLNAAYFSTLFKKETGKSFSEFVTGLRMESAKKLLGDREKSISDVAEMTGYIDEKYFTRVFKKNVGLSPNEYRKLYY